MHTIHYLYNKHYNIIRISTIINYSFSHTSCALSTSTEIEISVETTIENYEKEAKASKRRYENFSKMLTLAIAYSSNIGGTASLNGTPVNLIVYKAASTYV